MLKVCILLLLLLAITSCETGFDRFVQDYYLYIIHQNRLQNGFVADDEIKSKIEDGVKFYCTKFFIEFDDPHAFEANQHPKFDKEDLKRFLLHWLLTPCIKEEMIKKNIDNNFKYVHPSEWILP